MAGGDLLLYSNIGNRLRHVYIVVYVLFVDYYQDSGPSSVLLQIHIIYHTMNIVLIAASVILLFLRVF